MDNIAAGKPAIDFIKLCYAANRSPLLSGPHGVGKSELFEQATKQSRVKIIVCDLSLMEPPDLVGLPKMNGKTTTYSPPGFLPTTGKGILLFEEINRAPRYMRAPCLQLLTARTLNDYKLPIGWLPAAAINPADADYEVSELDPALLSRFVQANVIPDWGQWLQWAQRNGVHPAVVDYIETDVTIFNSPESNPRAWKYVSDVLKAADKNATDRATLRTAVMGLVGEKRGTAFLGAMKNGNPALTAEQILNHYDQHRSQVKQWIRDGKLDTVKASLFSIKKYLQPKADYQRVKRNRKRWQNLAKFVHDLPGDLRDDAKEFFHERDYTFPRRPKK